tara:strand:- start:4474 stop:5892 length:1419 start_codon:yes stop_codon:yes gene_type:complete
MNKYICVLCFLVLSNCSVNPVTGEQDFVLISEEREIQMGKRYHSQILEQYPVYKDDSLQDYVQSVGDTLAKNSHRSNLVFRFTILDDPNINAFALPGGYIYINRGLMSYLSSEEELAAVLAHEIGHVTARHSVKQYSQAQILGILTTAVDYSYGSSVGNIVNLTSGALLAGYGREMELQADGLGAQYIYTNGYDPMGMYRVLEVLKEQEIYSKDLLRKKGRPVQNYHGLFSSHPSNDSRLKEIISEAVVGVSQVNNSQQANYLEKIDGLVFGDSEESGIRRGDGFFHKSLDIFLKKPYEWEIINLPNALIFNSPKEEATLEVTLDEKNYRETPKEYLLRQISNIEFGEEIEINGFKGYLAKTLLYGKENIYAVIFRNDQIYKFYGFTKNKALSVFEKDFKDIIFSFDKLTGAQKRLALPLKIQLHRVLKGDTYSSLAKNSPISFDAEAKLRLLNGDYPDGRLKIGRIIKVIE